MTSSVKNEEDLEEKTYFGYHPLTFENVVELLNDWEDLSLEERNRYPVNGLSTGRVNIYLDNGESVPTSFDLERQISKIKSLYPEGPGSTHDSDANKSLDESLYKFLSLVGACDGHVLMAGNCTDVMQKLLTNFNFYPSSNLVIPSKAYKASATASKPLWDKLDVRVGKEFGLILTIHDIQRSAVRAEGNIDDNTSLLIIQTGSNIFGTQARLGTSEYNGKALEGIINSIYRINQDRVQRNESTISSNKINEIILHKRMADTSNKVLTRGLSVARYNEKVKQLNDEVDNFNKLGGETPLSYFTYLLHPLSVIFDDAAARPCMAWVHGAGSMKKYSQLRLDDLPFPAAICVSAHKSYAKRGGIAVMNDDFVKLTGFKPKGDFEGNAKWRQLMEESGATSEDLIYSLGISASKIERLGIDKIMAHNICLVYKMVNLLLPLYEQGKIDFVSPIIFERGEDYGSKERELIDSIANDGIRNLLSKSRINHNVISFNTVTFTIPYKNKQHVLSIVDSLEKDYGIRVGYLDLDMDMPFSRYAGHSGYPAAIRITPSVFNNERDLERTAGALYDILGL